MIMIKRYGMKTAETPTPIAGPPPLDQEPAAIVQGVQDELVREEATPQVDVGEMAQKLDESKAEPAAEQSENVRIAGHVVVYDKNAGIVKVKADDGVDKGDRTRLWKVFLPNANAQGDPNVPAGVMVAVIEVAAEEARPDVEASEPDTASIDAVEEESATITASEGDETGE
jgi:hypothetical protein